MKVKFPAHFPKHNVGKMSLYCWCNPKYAVDGRFISHKEAEALNFSKTISIHHVYTPEELEFIANEKR